MAALLAPLAAAAAPPLAPGTIVVAGFPYTWLPGYMPGPCDDALCAVDPALTTVTPISDAIPLEGTIADLAVEGPSSVVVLAYESNEASALYRVDVATGAVATLATGLPLSWNVASARGRLFVNGGADIYEVNRMTGAASVFVPGTWFGVDAEVGGRSLVTAHEIDCFPIYCNEFVRIDVGSGSATPFDPHFPERVTSIDVAPDGYRFVYAAGGIFGDGLVMRTGPSGAIEILLGGECSQTTTHGVVSDLDGNAIVGSDGAEPCPAVELQRIQPGVGVVASLDTDFGIAALDVVPRRACSNGVDDDGDGEVDWDGGGVGAADPGCGGNPNRNDERAAACGLGGELALLLPALAAIRRRGVRRG